MSAFRRVVRPSRFVLFAGGVFLLGLASCGNAPDQQLAAEPKPPEAEKAEDKEHIKLLGGDDGLVGAADILVADPTIMSRFEDPGYEQVAKLPHGTLKGVCYLPKAPPAGCGRGGPVDPGSGPDAIRNPRPGEVSYYKKARVGRPGWFKYDRKIRKHLVLNAAIIIKGIKAGGLVPLRRTSFNIYAGRFGANYNTRDRNFGDSRVMKFSPVKDLVLFRTYDGFDSHFLVRNVMSGEVVMDKRARAFDRKPVHASGNMERVFGHGVLPPHVPSSPFKRAGEIYKVSCQRHPWMEGYIIIVDNPYALSARKGKFSLSVPVGDWDVQVWHPVFQPAQKELRIRIHANKVTELGVPFRSSDSTKVVVGLKE